MLGAIFGALAGVTGAAVGIAGKATEGVGDALSIVAGDSPLGRALAGSVQGIGQGMQGYGERIANAEMPSFGGNLGGGGFSLSNPFGGGRDELVAAAPSKTPQVEIQAPAREISRYEVSPAELGGFSAPTFGSYAAGRDTGISV